MMYIRTKDDVYEVKEEINYGGEMFYYIKSKPPRKAFEECEILKQSENLEELCDEFVMTHYFKETNYTKCEVLKEDKDLMIKAVRLKKQHNKDKDLKNEFNIYGCIWTDKGLIYVAKMNDTGELELIWQE